MPIEPTSESARHYIDYTWKDVHHSRLQNWTGITVVTAFHVGILKIMEYYLNAGIGGNDFLKKNFWTAGAFMSCYFLLLMILDIICVFQIECILN